VSYMVTRYSARGMSASQKWSKLCVLASKILVMVNQMVFLGQLVEAGKMEMENKTESEKKEFFCKTPPEADGVVTVAGGARSRPGRWLIVILC